MEWRTNFNDLNLHILKSYDFVGKKCEIRDTRTNNYQKILLFYILFYLIFTSPLFSSPFIRSDFTFAFVLVLLWYSQVTIKVVLECQRKWRNVVSVASSLKFLKLRFKMINFSSTCAHKKLRGQSHGGSAVATFILSLLNFFNTLLKLWQSNYDNFLKEFETKFKIPSRRVWWGLQQLFQLSLTDFQSR